MSAAALGVTIDDVVRGLLRARTLQEVQALAEKLGAIGDDHAIDAVMPLVADTRDGVPEAIIGAFGAIASEHAVDVLLERTRDPRDGVRDAAIAALGTTRNGRAEDLLIELAERIDMPTQKAAVAALATVGDARAVAVIAHVASVPGDLLEPAVAALARIDSAEAREGLRGLVESPSVEVVVAALEAITTVDDALVATLATMLHDGDRTLIVPALHALGRAGDAAVPVLRDVIAQGATDDREPAMQALAKLGTPAAFAAVEELLASDDGAVADLAAGALAAMNSDAARDLLISTALGDRAEATHAVKHLMEMTGSDVEQALLAIAKANADSRDAVLQHLIKVGNAQAIELALADARGGDVRAMEMLVQGGNQNALDMLVALARQGGSPASLDALGVLAKARASDPAVEGLLRDVLRAGSPEASKIAAEALAGAGTNDARDALVAVLTASRSDDVVGAALASLSHYRLTDQGCAALRTAAGSHPNLAPQIMEQLVAARSADGLQLAKQMITGERGDDAAERAITALSKLGTAPAIEVLGHGAQASTSWVRAYAVRALGATHDRAATEIVIRALRDSSSSVNRTAVGALAEIGTPRAIDAIRAFALDRTQPTYLRLYAARTTEMDDVVRQLSEQNSTDP